MPRDFQRPFPLPEGASEIVLVRHGSSASAASGNGARIVESRTDPPLTDIGRRQAEAVAERLADERLERLSGLFVTPLRRTAQTAEPLTQRLGLEPVVVEDLREVHLGDWEGEANARLRDDPLTAQVFAVERWDVIPNAEKMEDFAARVRRGIDLVADACGAGRVAIAVVHGGVVAEACRQATGSTGFAFLYAENGSISRVMRLRSGRWALRSFNDIAHLRAIARASQPAGAPEAGAGK